MPVFVCVQPILNAVTDGEFFPNNFLIDFFAKDVCTLEMAVEGVCEDVIFLVCGYDKNNLNEVSVFSSLFRFAFLFMLFGFRSDPAPRLLRTHPCWHLRKKCNALCSGEE